MASGSPRKAENGAGLSLCGFFRATSRRRGGFQRFEKLAGGRRYLFNRGEERGFVCFRRFIETTHLSHELQGSRTNLFLRDRRFEVEQHLDVSAHEHCLDVSNPETRNRLETAQPRAGRR